MESTICRTILVLLGMLCTAMDAKAAEKKEKSVVLYSLRNCCSKVSWEAAEIGFEKELSTLGIRYLKHNAKTKAAQVSAASLEQFASRHGVAAAVLFYRQKRRNRGGVHILVFERSGGETESELFSFGTSDGKGADSLVVLKAVEAVYAAFFDRPAPAATVEPESSSEPDSTASSAEEAASPEDEQRQEDRKAREDDDTDESSESEDAAEALSTDDDDTGDKTERKHWGGGTVGPAIIWSPGGVGPLIGVEIAVQASPVKWIVLEISGLFSVYLISKQFDIQNTGVTFGINLLRGGLFLDILPNRRVHPQIGAVAGIAFTRTDGADENNPMTSKQAGHVAHLGGDARLSIDILPFLALRFGVRVGVLLPEVGIGAKIEDEDGKQDRVTPIRFGRPLTEGYLGFIVRL